MRAEPTASRACAGAGQQPARQRGHDTYRLKIPAGIHRTRSRLDRQSDVALDNPLVELRPFACCPKFGSVHDAVAEWATVRALATGDRPRNADEFSPHLVTREPNGRIAMAAEIDELEMRGKAAVRQGSRALQIEAFRIFQTG